MPSDTTPAGLSTRRVLRPFEPQLADRSTGELPTRHPWWFERKYDGIRLLVHVDDDGVVLRTRPGTDRTANFPHVVAAVEELGLTEAVLDAELVAFDRDGRDRFGVLQRHLGRPGRTPHAEPVSVRLMVFDLLRLAGSDLRSAPQHERRAQLEDLTAWHEHEPHHHHDDDDPMALAARLQGDPDQLLDRACEAGWEGLIAKRADAPYRAGRSSSWRKLVCTKVHPFVVGGWTTPGGTRPGLGAILVGTPTPDGLVYRGRVGTGLDDATLRLLATHLERARQDASPFLEVPPTDAGGATIRWCVPHLVVEVRYLGVTDAGRLRQARLVALRPDLAPDTASERVADTAAELPPDDRSV